jgi:hypothetical protein
MAKFALLQRQFLPKMYKSVGYLQNYPRESTVLTEIVGFSQSHLQMSSILISNLSDNPTGLISNLRLKPVLSTGHSLTSISTSKLT